MTSIPFQNVAFAKTATMVTGLSYVDVDVLTGATSTFGIDVNSVSAVVTSSPTAATPRWNAATQLLRIFRPGSGTPASMTVDYTFKDHLGNISNAATVTVDLTLLATDWRVYTPSVFCLVDAYSQNTGYKGYNLLELYYTGSGVTYTPLTTKPNVVGDPDYVSPTIDTSACPLPSTGSVLLRNDTPAGGTPYYISRVVFHLTGQPDIDFNGLTVNPGGTQLITLPSGIYTSLDVYHFHGTGGPFSVSYSPGNTNTVSQTLTGSSGVPNNFFSPAPVVHASGNTIRIY